jgi:RNA polymerase sigma-70 factor (sigma-E family)
VTAATAGVVAEAGGGDLLAALYAGQYRALLGLAGTLLDDPGDCEDVAQEAYLRVHRAWAGLDPDKAPAYLRQTVVNLARSALRRRRTARAHQPLLAAPAAAGDRIDAIVERDTQVAALRGLPRRQREAVVLRYHADLTTADTAAAMGCSAGAVKAYACRGLAALGAALAHSDADHAARRDAARPGRDADGRAGRTRGGEA